MPADLPRDEELVRRVRTALDEIEAGYAEVLVLRYLESKPVREIAAALGESEKAVESRLHRAREALRDRLKEEGP